MSTDPLFMDMMELFSLLVRVLACGVGLVLMSMITMVVLLATGKMDEQLVNHVEHP